MMGGALILKNRYFSCVHTLLVVVGVCFVNNLGGSFGCNVAF
jgi:hypothetical protein